LQTIKIAGEKGGIQEEWEKDLDEQLEDGNRISAHKNSIFERDD